MCILKFVTNKYLYKVKLERMINLKDSYKQQKKYLDYLLNKKIITSGQRYEGLNILYNGKKHCSHSMIQVLKEDTLTNEIKEYLFPITSSFNKVTIVPSLIESYLGVKAREYKVIKITEDLYITSHSLILETDLSINKYFEALKYDKVKDYYVDINDKEFTNLTKENVEKMSQEIVNRLESSDIKIEKIDITTSIDIKNDIVALTYLQELKKGTFDNKSYQEIDEEMDLIDLKFIKIEKEFNIELKKIEDEV